MTSLVYTFRLLFVNSENGSENDDTATAEPHTEYQQSIQPHVTNRNNKLDEKLKSGTVLPFESSEFQKFLQPWWTNLNALLAIQEQ